MGTMTDHEHYWYLMRDGEARCRGCPATLTNEQSEAMLNEHAALKGVLEAYATEAEWTAEVFLQGENADGSEWELTQDLDSEKVWNRDEHGWMLAQDALANTQE